jgi:hypothetical protein
MQPNKQRFQKGNKVVLTEKAPKWLHSLLKRNRKRTIVNFYYDKTQQHVLYYLGSNYHGDADIIAAYSFRAEQLKRYITKPIGRPLSKRTLQKLRRQIPQSIPNYLERHKENSSLISAHSKPFCRAFHA